MPGRTAEPSSVRGGPLRCDEWADLESIKSRAQSPGTGWFNGGLVNDGGRLCILWLHNPVEVAP